MSSGSQLSILPHPEPTPELPQRAEGQIIVGDTLEELKKFPEETFQCCVTSPPYWGLRDYGIPGQIGAEMKLDDYITTSPSSQARSGVPRSTTHTES